MDKRYCKQCNNKINDFSEDRCAKCRKKYVEEVLKKGKTTLEEAEKQLEKALRLGVPDLIRNSKEIKRNAEEAFEEAVFSYLCSLLMDEINPNLTNLEKNYRTVKNHPLYTSQKKSFNEGNWKNNKEKLDDHYDSVKNWLKSITNHNNSPVSNNHRERERERERTKSI